MSLPKFIQYHNAVPITLSLLLLGAGSAFAMSPDIREAVGDSVYDTRVTVISIDNTYIAQKDLDTYTPSVEILSVTEDNENYYVEYTLSTIALEDYVWQDIAKNKTMVVYKDDLGKYRDLGLYVTNQLGQVIKRELVYLKEVQEIERKSVTQKTVATEYGGLVGALLNDKTESVAGYTPVVTAPPVVRGNGATDSSASTQHTDQPTVTTSKPSNSPVSLKIIGTNPSRIPLRSQYSDLGALVVVNGKVMDYTIHTYLEGKEVSSISIDTSTSTRYIVTYRAQDADGNAGEATRVILVGDAELGDITVDQTNIPITYEPYEDTVKQQQTTQSRAELESTSATTTLSEEVEASTSATSTKNIQQDQETSSSTASSTIEEEVGEEKTTKDTTDETLHETSTTTAENVESEDNSEQESEDSTDASEAEVPESTS